MADGGYIENRHNSAADCPISVKFCVGSSFSHNFGNGTLRTDTRVTQNVCYCFPNVVWVSASGDFRIVSDTLIMKPTVAFMPNAWMHVDAAS